MRQKLGRDEIGRAPNSGSKGSRQHIGGIGCIFLHFKNLYIKTNTP